MGLLSSVQRVIARHPVATFLVVGIGVGLAAAATPPLVEARIPPFGLPLFAVAGGISGVGVAAFVVTAATSGRPGVVDLARRSLRWRVPVRWYLLALFTVPVGATLLALVFYGPRALESPSGGWPRVLAEAAGLFVFQLVLFQLPEEIGFTGFLQDRWQDRYSPLRLSVYVAFWWALWHVPDFFGEEGWGIEQLITAPVIFVIEFVSLFFARVLFVWLYARTGRSVLLVAIFHASFDASINRLSTVVVPGSNTARLLIFTAVIVLAATAVIVLMRGRFTGGASRPGTQHEHGVPPEQPGQEPRHRH
jgi:uncharacterized protein